MPVLPQAKKLELIEDHGLSSYDAAIITAERENVDYFMEVFESCGDAKLACNWMTSELFGKLNKEGLKLEASPVNAANLGALVKHIKSGTLSGKMAKEVFEEMFSTSKSPDKIIEEKGLKQVSDPAEIAKIIEEVVTECSDQVADFITGNERIFGFLVGQAMKKSAGKANPQIVNDALKAKIASLSKETE